MHVVQRARAMVSVTALLVKWNMRIAPILGTEEKAMLVAGMCYLEGHYHRETQIRSQMTGLVLFRGVLLHFEGVRGIFMFQLCAFALVFFFSFIFCRGAYYTVSPFPGFRIVSLNTNACNNMNWSVTCLPQITKNFFLWWNFILFIVAK
jgi:hypothetical protein